MGVMIKPETVIIESEVLNGVAESVDALFDDLSIGGVAIRGLLSGPAISELVKSEGCGFSEFEPFQKLFGQVAETLTGDSHEFATRETGPFIYSHPWHIAYSDYPDITLRSWVHLRGTPRLWLARAKDKTVRSGYDLSDDEVLEDAFALPTPFDPEVGDVLLFIDRGSSERLGSSTFHKTEVPHGDAFRLSVACDTYFPYRDFSK